MPVQIRYQNNSDQECIIRPTPLVSISTNILKNGAGEAFGVSYTITLTGTLLPEEGTPYAINHIGSSLYGFFDEGEHGTRGPYNAFDGQSYANGTKPPRQKIDTNNAASAIFSKQKVLRALFAQDGQKVEITDIIHSTPTVTCYPRFVDINFSEGIYVNRCDYTITLEADTLLIGDGSDATVEYEGSLITGGIQTDKTETQLLDDLNGAFISDFTEDWSVEVDESQGEIIKVSNDEKIIPRSYKITHSLNATGKTHYKSDGTKLDAWEQAKTFVQNRLSDNIDGYPNILGTIGKGTIDLVDTYGGFNHVRTEQVSESAGTYNVSENWLIAQGKDYENYNLSTASSSTDPFISVTIDGNIKGLSQLSPTGYRPASVDDANSAYDNAKIKYDIISNAGDFGTSSEVYKRANNSIDGITLNSQPVSFSLGTNEFTGEITYNLAFNNRPTNLITGAVTETLSINDTYPGDMFAVIPVLGRATGPVLQYIGGRTEYRRDVSLSLTMDHSTLADPLVSSRAALILYKPSIKEPTATQIASLLQQVSPQGEPGIRKYFASPATENWNPKEGTYQLTISFTYELDR